VLQQHGGTHARRKLTGKTGNDIAAAHFGDSASVGGYGIDLHPASGGENYIDMSSLPFEIPMGALLPRRWKISWQPSRNLGVTHITNGCYRLHPVEWSTGESAGLLAARAVPRKTPPRRIRNHEKLRRRISGLDSEPGRGDCLAPAQAALSRGRQPTLIDPSYPNRELIANRPHVNSGGEDRLGVCS